MIVSFANYALDIFMNLAQTSEFVSLSVFFLFCLGISIPIRLIKL